MKKEKSTSNQESQQHKLVLHTILLAAIIITTIIISKNIVQTVISMYQAQPNGAGISCFFDMLY